MSDASPLEFPCEILIKVLGKNEQAFRDAAFAIVARHFGAPEETAVTERLSRADKYLSLTITVLARSRAEIDAAYRDLSAHDRIIMAL